MALRLSFAAVVVPFVFACGNSTRSSANPGSSPGGVMTGPAGAGSGEAAGSSGALGSSAGAVGAGLGGVSAHGGSSPVAGSAARAGAGGAAGQSVSAGLGGAPTNGGGTGAAPNAGSANAGAPGTDGSGGQTSGIPAGWIMVNDIDYSIVPGPNFETVRLMFGATPCSGSSCHFGGRNHMTVGRPADELYRYMLNFKTLECGKLIDTAHPSESALVKYLRAPCGAVERMPSGKCFDDGDPQCVPEYYIQLIEQWIANGAPR